MSFHCHIFFLRQRAGVSMEADWGGASQPCA